MGMSLDATGLKMVSKQLSNLELATTEERAAEREAVVWLKYATYALVVIAILAILAALNVAKMVMMPVIAGVIMGLILGPIGDKGRAYGIPNAVTFGLLSLGILFALYAIFQILLPVGQQIVNDMPTISQRLTELSWRLDSWMSAFKELRASRGAPAAAVPTPEQTTAVEMATKAVEVVSPAISQFLIFVFTMLLFFASRTEIRQALTMKAKTRDARLAMLKTFSNVEAQLTGYFFTVAMINLGLAAAVGVAFLLIGVPGALTWAVATFFVNFLPVIGPLMIKAALIVYGVIFAPTAMDGILPIATFLFVSLVEANFVTPRIVGEKITMNPLLVFVSVVFWTWMWGFAGAFLAMPILAIASVIRHEFSKDDSVSLPS